MSKLESVSPAARSWRDIPQAVAPRAMSATGRRRLILSGVRMALLGILAVATAWGGWEIWNTWQTLPQAISGGKSQPIETVELRTDGILDLEWAESALALAPGVGLMDVDLGELQSRLTRSGQVRSAELTRRFPATLVVTLQERTPVARVRAAIGDGLPADFLVARDGAVYVGAGYGPAVVESLPWLDGIRLEAQGEGFAPLTGMALVADLLAVAQGNTPALYRSWSIVDLGRLASDGEILVRSRIVPEIVFGTRDDFFSQVAMLDSMIEQISLNPALPSPERINLAIGGREVPVAFGDRAVRTVDPRMTPAPSSFFRSNFRNQL